MGVLLFVVGGTLGGEPERQRRITETAYVLSRVEPCRVLPLAPTGERTGDDEAYPAVFTAVMTVFVLLVGRRSAVIAIVQSRRGASPDAECEQHTKGDPPSSGPFALSVPTRLTAQAPASPSETVDSG